MAIIIQKFGGTSVADAACFLNAADKVAEEVKKGHQAVAVVSAMAGETNRLIELTRQLSLTPNASEYDVVIASGEQVACGLFALALQEKGIQAKSLLGWQIPMETCENYSRARYQRIIADTILAELSQGNVIVIPGFQGVSPQNRITTLGRGGSDITAVAIAAALKAERCDIYTDVQGVYTADPRIVRNARLLEKVSYEEMLELASQGAKVLQNRAVSLAMNQNVCLRVLSSFEDLPGTWIVPEEQVMEKGIVRGITHSTEDIFVILKGVANEAGMGAKIFSPLAQGNISIDMITYLANGTHKTDLSFTFPRVDLERGKGILNAEKETIGFETLEINSNVAKVTIVGTGLRNYPQITSKAFEILGTMGIDIYKTSTSEVKLSFLIPQEYAELAVRSLHSAYELGEKN